MKITQKTIDWFADEFDEDIEGMPLEDVQERAVKMLRDGDMSAEQYAEFASRTAGDMRDRHKAYVQSLLNDGKPNSQPTLDEMEQQIIERHQRDGTFKNLSGSGARLMEMAHQEAGTGTTSGEPRIRVKGLDESYSTQRRVVKHARWDTPIFPVRNGSMSSEPVQSLSEFECAKIGAYFRRKAALAGVMGVSLTEHDRALLAESYEKDVWLDDSGDSTIRHTKGIKALIEDATSGGEALVPEYFDNALVTFPLLHSEVLPYVDIVDVPRGSAVETASIGNPTLTWNHAEGTAHDLFDTEDLVAAITASIFPVACYLEAGRDLLADASPAQVGATIMTNMGERMAQELDKVIVAGDGVTQPQGITEASLITDVPSANAGTGGALTVDDLLNLMFAVGKQYRTPSMNPRFAMNDQTYKGHRALATGVTGDDRLLHGMSVQSYTLLESPVSIENEGLAQHEGIFGAFKRYRLWRRAGFMTRVETGGASLVRNNTVLIYGRGRYGGKVVDTNAFAIIDDWQNPLP